MSDVDFEISASQEHVILGNQKKRYRIDIESSEESDEAKRVKVETLSNSKNKLAGDIAAIDDSTTKLEQQAAEAIDAIRKQANEKIAKIEHKLGAKKERLASERLIKMIKCSDVCSKLAKVTKGADVIPPPVLQYRAEAIGWATMARRGIDQVDEAD